MTIKAYLTDFLESHGGDDCRAMAETNKLEAIKAAFRAGFECARDESGN